MEVLQHLSENKRIYSIILENYPNLLQFRSVSDKGLNMLPPSEGATIATRVPIKYSMKLKKGIPETSENVELENDVFLDNVELKRSEMKTGKNKFDEIVPPTKALLNKRKNIMQQHAYFRNIRFRKNSMCYKGALLNIHKYKSKATSCPDIYRNSMVTIPKDEETVSRDIFILT